MNPLSAIAAVDNDQWLPGAVAPCLRIVRGEGNQVFERVLGIPLSPVLGNNVLGAARNGGNLGVVVLTRPTFANDFVHNSLNRSSMFHRLSVNILTFLDPNIEFIRIWGHLGTHICRRNNLQYL